MRSPAPPAADPPLTPTGGEGRRLLGEELADPDYAVDLLQRISQWVERLFNGMIDAASRAGSVGWFVAILVAFVLIGLVLLLLTQYRSTSRLPSRGRPALSEERITAAELRARAVAAMAAGEHDDALVDGFRALAVRQLERGRIDDLPQATAHELATALATEYAGDAAAIVSAADIFDAVLYGDHGATREQAQSVLGLDERLGAVRR